MKQTARALALILSLLPAMALAQSAPPSMGYHTLWGRLGAAPGDSGPASAIPFTTLQSTFPRSGNGTTFGTTSGALTAGDCLKADAHGNIVDSGTTSCGAGTNTPHTQDFIGGTNYTAGSTTSLTLSSAPSSSDLLFITFDGVGQNANTWSLVGAVVTFNAAIPTNTAVVEAKWSTAGTSSGVGSLGLSGSPLTGAVTVSPGTGIAITQVGQNIAIASTSQVVSIKDAAYGAKCDGVFQSSQNFDFPSTNLTISSGSPNLFSSGSTFTAADVGKNISVGGAGVAGAGLSTTIQTFTDATHVVLAANASTTLSGVAATNAKPLVYGTDDTAAIQAAMTATPTGGTLYIPGQRTGCIIRQQGANTYALLQNHPFSIRGDGHFSNLMTFPDIPSTVDNLFVDGTAGWDWANVSWTGFSIGVSPSYIPPTFIMYKRYGKRGLVLSDSPATNFVNVLIDNITVGESGNDYSIYIGNAVSSPSQTVTVSHSKIFGGIRLDNVSDSFRITSNQLFGASILGGSFTFVGGAGMFLFSDNNVTWAGCTTVESGTKPVFRNNYFEEVLNASSCASNAMVNFNGGAGTVISPTFVGNIVGALVSTTATPVRYANVTGGVFGDNYISTSTARTGVTSTALLSCIAPNTWNSASPHFSTALANTYAGC